MASVFRRKDRKGGGKAAPWSFKYKDFTGRYVYGTGWSDKMKTLRHAQDLEAEHAAIRRGEKPIPQKTLSFTAPIDDVTGAYMAWGRAQGGRYGRPWSKQNADLKQTYLKMWKERLDLEVLGDIQLGPVENVIQDFLKSGNLAPKSVSLRVEALKAMCRWCVKRGMLPADPLGGLTPVAKAPKKPHRPLTHAQLARLLDKAPAERRFWYRVALATGFRYAELRALTVGSLDLFTPALNLDADFTKNKKPARQVIPREIADRLRDMAEGKPEHAPLLGMPRHANRAIQTDLAAACIKVETPEGRATWHSLRKCYVDALVQSGADVKSLTHLARHSTGGILTLDVYASADVKRLKEFVEAAWTYLNAGISGADCSGYVPRAVNQNRSAAGSHSSSGTYCGSSLVGVTGLEPVTSAV